MRHLPQAIYYKQLNINMLWKMQNKRGGNVSGEGAFWKMKFITFTKGQSIGSTSFMIWKTIWFITPSFLLLQGNMG